MPPPHRSRPMGYLTLWHNMMGKVGSDTTQQRGSPHTGRAVPAVTPPSSVGLPTQEGLCQKSYYPAAWVSPWLPAGLITWNSQKGTVIGYWLLGVGNFFNAMASDFLISFSLTCCWNWGVENKVKDLLRKPREREEGAEHSAPPCNPSREVTMEDPSPSIILGMDHFFFPTTS